MNNIVWIKKCKPIVWLLIIVILCLTFFALINLNKQNHIERKLITAIDQCCKSEGEYNIDLTEIFTEFEWDTASIFVAGNSRQIMDVLGVDNDVSDGIVFSRHGIPIIKHMSTYQFPEDIPPNVSYYVERTDSNDPYYVSLPFDDAVIHAEKYRCENGSYKYNIYQRVNRETLKTEE